MSGELNTDNTDATGFSQMAVVLLSLHTGRARSSEDGLNVHLCLGRGALPSATRGLDGVGLSVCKDTTMPYVSEKWREIACNGWQ